MSAVAGYEETSGEPSRRQIARAALAAVREPSQEGALAGEAGFGTDTGPLMASESGDVGATVSGDAPLASPANASAGEPSQGSGEAKDEQAVVAARGKTGVEGPRTTPASPGEPSQDRETPAATGDDERDVISSLDVTPESWRDA